MREEVYSQRSEGNHLVTEGSQRLKVVLFVIAVIMVAEVIGGILSNSLALVGDAGHMLVDVLALGMSLLAINIARRPATPTKTYGYYRAEILAALANGIILALVASYVFYEAYQRFMNPRTVQPVLMLVVAVIGLIANLVGILLLRKLRHISLNIKSAFWHILGDTISSVA